MTTLHSPTRRTAFSIIELLAVLTIVGIVAVLIVSRTTSHLSDAQREACLLSQGEIELQVQLWRRHFGSFPAADLSDIGSNLEYFPTGLPDCPVDGSPYSIDTTTGTVTGHTH